MEPCPLWLTLISLSVMEECCSLRACLGLPGHLLQLTQGRDMWFRLCPVYPQPRRNERKRSRGAFPPAHTEVSGSQCRAKETRASTTCFSATHITPSPLPLPLLASGAGSWSCSVPYVPVNSFQGLRDQPGHQSPSGSLSRSLNRSCGSPGLRAVEGVHAKVLCFRVRRSEVEG